MAQGTKVDLCKFMTAKVGITSFAMPNNKHLAPFVDLILTLIWDPSMNQVFPHIEIGPNHMDHRTKP